MRLFDLYEPLKLDGAVNYIECQAHAQAQAQEHNQRTEQEPQQQLLHEKKLVA